MAGGMNTPASSVRGARVRQTGNRGHPRARGEEGGRAQVKKTAGGESRGAGAMAGGMELTAHADWAL